MEHGTDFVKVLTSCKSSASGFEVLHVPILVDVCTIGFFLGKNFALKTTSRNEELGALRVLFRRHIFKFKFPACLFPWVG